MIYIVESAAKIIIDKRPLTLQDVMSHLLSVTTRFLVVGQNYCTLQYSQVRREDFTEGVGLKFDFFL